MGYCPVSQFESRYNICIVTQGNTTGIGAQGIGHDTARARPRHGQACATIRRAVRAIRPAARDLAGGVCRDTKFCIVTGARDWPLGVVSRYSLCIVTGGRSG